MRPDDSVTHRGRSVICPIFRQITLRPPSVRTAAGSAGASLGILCMISACSDVGVLIGGFVLRLLVLLAALPVTMTVAWTF